MTMTTTLWLSNEEFIAHVDLLIQAYDLASLWTDVEEQTDGR